MSPAYLPLLPGVRAIIAQHYLPSAWKITYEDYNRVVCICCGPHRREVLIDWVGLKHKDDAYAELAKQTFAAAADIEQTIWQFRDTE